MAITTDTTESISSNGGDINENLNLIFPTGKNSIIYKGIQAITYNKFLRFCQAHGLNINLFANVMFFEISKEMESNLRKIYYKIKQDNYYTTQDFSFVDFLLACVAAHYNIPVVSFDNHVIHHLQKYLTYNALWPTDVIRTPFITPILLDTNIIYSLVFKKINQLQNIQQMIQLDNITFMIPELIIEELTNLYRKEQKILQNQKNFQPKSKKFKIFIDEETSRPKYRSKKNNYNNSH